MNIILIGPPGSGKGVQAKLLSKELKLPHVSVGAHFREIIAKRTIRGLEVKHYIEKGELVPDMLTVRILLRRLKRKEVQNGFILDGFPRTLNQAKKFHRYVGADSVLLIHIPPRESIKRISSRRECVKKAHAFGAVNPPKKKGICDFDGSKLVQRKDDRPVVVKKRLEIYQKEMGPIIKWYREQDLLKTIDGMASITTVHKNIKKYLKTIV